MKNNSEVPQAIALDKVQLHLRDVNNSNLKAGQLLIIQNSTTFHRTYYSIKEVTTDSTKRYLVMTVISSEEPRTMPGATVRMSVAFTEALIGHILDPTKANREIPEENLPAAATIQLVENLLKDYENLTCPIFEAFEFLRKINLIPPGIETTRAFAKWMRSVARKNGGIVTVTKDGKYVRWNGDALSTLAISASKAMVGNIQNPAFNGAPAKIRIHFPQFVMGLKMLLTSISIIDLVDDEI